MQIINMIVLAFVSRLLGGVWGNEIPRIYILASLFGYVLSVCEYDLLQFGAIIWLFVVARLLPTAALLATCINHQSPIRDDGRWNFLHRWTTSLWHRFPEIKLLDNWYFWGILYGVVRNLLSLPAMVYLGGLAYLLLAQGLIYWICGRINQEHGNKYAEAIIGGIIGACIYV